MWLYHTILPHPRCWFRWANPAVSQQPRHWPEPLPDSGLGWATLDKGRLSDAPRSYATKPTAGPTTDTSVTPTSGPYLSYAIDDQLETSRPNRAGRIQSRTAILTGNTPLRPDYHRAARSGFAASAIPALPPKTPLCSSPLPRSDRLGSTIPLGRPDLCCPSPAANPQMDPTPTVSPVSNYTTPEYDACAAAEQLSNTSLSATGIKLNAQTPYATPPDVTYKLVAQTPLPAHFVSTCPYTRDRKSQTSLTSPLKVAC